MKDADSNKSWAGLEIVIILAIVVGIILIWTLVPDKEPVKGNRDTVKSEEPEKQPEKDGETKPADPIVYLPFEKSSEGLPEAGAWRGDPVAVDLNHDGNVDIVTSLRLPEREQEEKDQKVADNLVLDPEREIAYDSGLYVFLGDGKGNWTESIEGIPTALGYGGADVADFNLDGNPDIAFSTHKGPMCVFLGDGKGAWTEASEGIDNESIIQDVTAKDFTGDGLPDLVAISQFPENGGLWTFKNMGDGTWTRLHENTLMKPNTFGGDILGIDIDQDGDNDFVVTTDKGLRVFLNDGTGNFTDTSLGLPRPKTGGILQDVAVGDINGDGDYEIVMGAYADKDQAGLEMFERASEAEWDKYDWKPLYTGPYKDDFTHGLALGDMDGDGDLDLVTSSFEMKRGPRLIVWENDGQGIMKETGRIEGGSGRADVKLADFNNDGLMDILTVYSGGATVYLQKEK